MHHYFLNTISSGVLNRLCAKKGSGHQTPQCALADEALAIEPQTRAPVDIGPQEGYYSAWVAWEKGKVETRKTSQGARLSLSSRLPRQSSPPPVAHYL